MKNIEVEIRSLIEIDEYDNLLKFFKKEGKLLSKENQASYYFSGEHDLRTQLSDKTAKIWLKKGKLHDDAREEIEVKLDRKEFENANKLFEALGYQNEITWLRTRFTFNWKGVKVMLDNTKGYGCIIELEKMASPEKKEIALQQLRQKMELINVKETSKEVFNQKFEYYKKNWKKLIVNK